MNYSELAVAYDNQADLILAAIPDHGDLKFQAALSTVLELREKAEDCRNHVRAVERAEIEHKSRLEYDAFERDIRTRWLEAEVRQAVAQERKAAVYEALAALWGAR